MITIVKKDLYNTRINSNKRGCVLISNKFMKTIPITLIILISMFASYSFVQPIKGISSNNDTTFYFKDVLGINSEPEYDSNLGLTVLVSELFPSKINDSVYPPTIFNGLTFNSEEWITWFSTTWLFYFLEDLTGEYDNFSDFGDLFDGLELLFPNPLRIIESYEYSGNETIIIKGNVNFNLFLSSKLFSKISLNDKVNVGLYYLNPNSIFPIPIKISNKTIELNPELFQNIKMQEIIIENVNHTLDPGESLLFEIELIPGNKTIIDLLTEERPVLEDLANRAIEILYDLSNNSDNPTLLDIIEIIEMVEGIAEEVNITREDAAIVLNSLISTSLVYDSINHPSSVSLPFSTPSENDGENNVTYYLYSNNFMNYQIPDSDEHSVNDLTNSNEWIGPSLDRSKILQEANTIIYVNYKDINYFSDNIKINGKLIYDNQEIGSSEFVLDKTQLTSPTSIIPINMIFNDLQDMEEIEYDTSFILEISIDNTSDFGRGILKKAELFYDSIEYPSRMSLTFTETDNIKLDIATEPNDHKIIPGGSVKYSVDIFSKLDDEIEIVELSYTGNKEYWDIQIPDKVSISSGDTTTLELIITSTENDLSIYGEDIDIEFSAQGKTGKSIFTTYALISEDAVDYDIKVIVPPDKDIKHGTSGSYFFIIENNNTGLWPDNYSLEAISENDWNLTINPDSNINNLDSGESIEINITIYVPKNTEITSDNLIFIINSDKSEFSKTVNVTSNIIGPNIMEDLYNYFESLAESLGLDDIFDEYAPHALVVLLFSILFIILILLVFIITSKFVDIICLDRIIEISPNQTGLFEIKLINPTKKARYYEINIVDRKKESKWLISFNKDKIHLNPKESRKITFGVQPTDLVQKDDWAEIDLIVKTDGKRKIEKISTMIVLKNSITNLSINNIIHLPRIFKEGEKIVTSFILKNKGNVSSENIVVLLYINGEEKNKVVDIIIPAEGYAELDIPWIAVKGKNEISIVVKKY